MHHWVAVHLASGGLQDFGTYTLRQAEHVNGAHDAGLSRLHWIVLVVNRRGRAGHVIDLVHLDIEREGDVVVHRLKMRVAGEVRDVDLAAGEVVVHTQHIVAITQQALAQVRAKEAGAASYHYAFHGRTT